jgi:hypothetical protein
MIELAVAVILHTQSPVYIKPQPKVAILLGESEVQKKERDEREAEEIKKRTIKKIKKGSSYTGNGTAKIIGESNEQCVVFARRITGNAKIHGYAGNIPPETQTPSVGAVALESGHVSVVVAVADSFIIVHEANYIRSKITERKVPLNKIRGFVL